MVLLPVFFNYHDVVRNDFLPTGQTVNKDYHLNALLSLREVIYRKRLEYDEKTHECSSMVIRLLTMHLFLIFLTKFAANTAPQALYSPDLAPCDFFFVTRLILLFHDHRFEFINPMTENLL